jgi:dTDP-4-amino-4,6-dideoxygalactose transaminase
MAIGVHKITEQFEAKLCDYTGAPYAVAVDNCSNALFLALKWFDKSMLFEFGRPSQNWKQTVTIPSHTYVSVPCEVIHAGMPLKFEDSTELLTGKYNLKGTNVWDCALHFTTDMYIPKTLMCLSFTGPYKHLKLGKGGAILTDNKEAYEWFKRSRFSGRRECSYLEDDFDMLGWNFYMMPEIAARGLLLMDQFYTETGKKHNEPITHRYPNLSKFKIYQNVNL